MEAINIHIRMAEIASVIKIYKTLWNWVLVTDNGITP
jgi:hypothetical protein